MIFNSEARSRFYSIHARTRPLLSREPVTRNLVTAPLLTDCRPLKRIRCWGISSTYILGSTSILGIIVSYHYIGYHRIPNLKYYSNVTRACHGNECIVALYAQYLEVPSMSVSFQVKDCLYDSSSTGIHLGAR